jgi:hypothetical protein
VSPFTLTAKDLLWRSTLLVPQVRGLQVRSLLLPLALIADMV